MTKTSINLLTRIVSSSVSLYGQVIFVAQTHTHTHMHARESTHARARIFDTPESILLQAMKLNISLKLLYKNRLRWLVHVVFEKALYVFYLLHKEGCIT